MGRPPCLFTSPSLVDNSMTIHPCRTPDMFRSHSLRSKSHGFKTGYGRDPESSYGTRSAILEAELVPGLST